MELKGDAKRGLRLVATGFSDEAGLIADLVSTLTLRETFLSGATVELGVRNLALTPGLLAEIATVFDRFPAITLGGVVREPERTEPIPLARRLDPPLVVRHTLRSGQHQYHSGDLIIVGDVNPGATVAAAGDILVFGRLRGSAHAGQPNDLQKAIYALTFTPGQIRIGTVVAIGESSGTEPEYAHVDDGQIVVEPWKDIALPEAVTQDPRHRRSSLANP